MKVGIVGGGQLARMLALAGVPLGHEFLVLTPDRDAPAAPVAELLLGDYDDPELLRTLAARVDVVTYEFENLPVDALARLAASVPLRPGVEALRISQDRAEEKACFTALGIPVAPYRPVASLEELREAAQQIPLPALLKTRRLGYDGKGQVPIASPDRLDEAWERIGKVPCLLESKIAFERELSIVAARDLQGEIRIYPLVENHHERGILRRSIAPAPALSSELLSQAEDYVFRLLQRLDYVGVLALECFVHEGRLLANEMAPRVHNSGHWTLEGADTSQFENHLRAITGAPLGSCSARGESRMLNLIGALPPLPELLAIEGAHVHLYGKEAKPGRKLGHVTLVGEPGASWPSRCQELESRVEIFLP
mgnify:CR=1 FL=1